LSFLPPHQCKPVEEQNYHSQGSGKLSPARSRCKISDFSTQAGESSMASLQGTLKDYIL
jgi:hypothetical protein